MKDPKRTLITSAGGFVGHHLVKRLESGGHWVRGVDLKNPQFARSAADEFPNLDLRQILMLAVRALPGYLSAWFLVPGSYIR